MALAAIASISVSSALIWALFQSQKKPAAGTELYNTENKPAPEGLTALPRDYSGLPRNVPPLGPPLPGDLGRPIRNAQLSGPGEPGVDAEQQRVAQETEAARTSRLFATTNVRERPPAALTLPTPTAAEQTAAQQSVRTEGPPLDPDSILNMQDRKHAFLTAAVDRKTVSPDRLANPASRYVVQAGGVIQPAKILSGLEQRGKISRGWTWQKFGSARNCFRFRGRALW